MIASSTWKQQTGFAHQHLEGNGRRFIHSHLYQTTAHTVGFAMACLYAILLRLRQHQEQRKDQYCLDRILSTLVGQLSSCHRCGVDSYEDVGQTDIMSIFGNTFELNLWLGRCVVDIVRKILSVENVTGNGLSEAGSESMLARGSWYFRVPSN